LIVAIVSFSVLLLTDRIAFRALLLIRRTASREFDFHVPAFYDQLFVPKTVFVFVLERMRVT